MKLQTWVWYTSLFLAGSAGAQETLSADIIATHKEWNSCVKNQSLPSKDELWGQVLCRDLEDKLFQVITEQMSETDAQQLLYIFMHPDPAGPEVWPWDVKK